MLVGLRIKRINFMHTVPTYLLNPNGSLKYHRNVCTNVLVLIEVLRFRDRLDHNPVHVPPSFRVYAANVPILAV